MEDTRRFWIDRQFGTAIFVDAENGIVKTIYNESPKFIARMEELYKGKEITFLKEDFEKRMKGTFHCVHSLAITEAKRQVEAVQSHIDTVNKFIQALTVGQDAKYEELKKSREKLTSELHTAKQELKEIKEHMLTEHRWNFD